MFLQSLRTPAHHLNIILVLNIIMLSLTVFAAKNSNTNTRKERRKKMIDTRKADLKTIRGQLKNISTEERKRIQDMWKMHRNFFTDDETLDVVVMPEQSIDEYFEN